MQREKQKRIKKKKKTPGSVFDTSFDCRKLHGRMDPGANRHKKKKQHLDKLTVSCGLAECKTKVFFFFFSSQSPALESSHASKISVFLSQSETFSPFRKKEKLLLLRGSALLSSTFPQRTRTDNCSLSELNPRPSWLARRLGRRERPARRGAQLSRHPPGRDSPMAGAGWGQVTGWQSLLITRLPCNPSTGGGTRPLNFRAPESRWRNRRLLQV